MATAEHRDELLEQTRALPVEDRDYIEAALVRDAHEQGRRTDTPEGIAPVQKQPTSSWSRKAALIAGDASLRRL